jgi:hypothetical protein
LENWDFTELKGQINILNSSKDLLYREIGFMLGVHIMEMLRRKSEKMNLDMIDFE